MAKSYYNHLWFRKVNLRHSDDETDQEPNKREKTDVWFLRRHVLFRFDKNFSAQTLDDRETMMFVIPILFEQWDRVESIFLLDWRGTMCKSLMHAQKAIGEPMRNSAKIRQLVQINSDGILAMKFILSDENASIRNVLFLSAAQMRLRYH